MEAFTGMACRPDYHLYEAHRDVPVRARRTCAELIGAAPDEIAVGFNTTFGINLAASALGLGPGDRVLLMDGEFPANVYPWLNLERRGVAVELIPRDSRGLPNEEAALERLARGDIRVFSASSVNFCTGYRIDLEAVSTVNVAATRVDILACGGQKWLLSPQGAGFAYIRRELIEHLDPVTVGWLGYEQSQDYANLLDYRLDPLSDARRFELGSLAFSSVDAFNHSLSMLLELGAASIEQHVLAVQQVLIDWIESRQDVQMVSDLGPGRRSGIIAFSVSDPVKLHERLQSAGITVSLREGAIRVSVHVFNSREDIERLISVAESVLET
jgi:selenocysteine lyase/cysteine desulfurase